MSAGGSIPYHLRQNKAIERNLFVDLLARIGRFRNISDYSYIGFGGPFLEDFKHLHSALRISKMVSLEMDRNVYQRQKFNKPLSCIELRNETSDEFLSDYEFESADGSIVWFDYATPNITSQLTEVQRLTAKLGHGDVFKVTLNANPASLGNPTDGSDLREYRARAVMRKLSSYSPAQVTADDVTPKNYPSVLLHALMSAAKHGLEGDPGLIVQPLTAFVYSDGQQMLTMTGILLREDEVEPFLTETRLRHWTFFNETCRTPVSISVPALSAKERVHIESMLPGATVDDINENLQFYAGSTERIAGEEMENFINFYRLFPWYSRVVL
jgi:hypothetical protein